MAEYIKKLFGSVAKPLSKEETATARNLEVGQLAKQRKGMNVEFQRTQDELEKLKKQLADDPSNENLKERVDLARNKLADMKKRSPVKEKPTEEGGEKIVKGFMKDLEKDPEAKADFEAAVKPPVYKKGGKLGYAKGGKPIGVGAAQRGFGAVMRKSTGGGLRGVGVAQRGFGAVKKAGKE